MVDKGSGKKGNNHAVFVAVPMPGQLVNDGELEYSGQEHRHSTRSSPHHVTVWLTRLSSKDATTRRLLYASPLLLQTSGALPCRGWQRLNVRCLRLGQDMR